VGISHSEVSRIELGEAARVPYETLVTLGAVLGLDVPLRTFPAGDPIRDAAQLALLAKLRVLLPPTVQWRTEVPLDRPGDLRAWDALVRGPGWRVPIDAETRLRDVQAFARRFALKRRDDGVEIAVLLASDTRNNRHAIRLARLDLAAEFPEPGDAVLRALISGNRPSGSGIVLL
jgi:transcriptional regulator with XRE-family HTH domain